MQKDLVIGAITGYTWDQIKYWVNSLDRSGFTGVKAVLAYNVDYDTLEQLSKRGYVILAFQKDDAHRQVVYPNQNFNIVVDRFLHYYLMLDTPENRASIRYVVATDVKDVIFQCNPSDYLDRADMACHDLVVSSEGIAYQHEPWGANNLAQSFGPIMYEKHKHETIINCGVLAGRFSTFMGLCKSIYLLSWGTVQHVPGGGGPDQAALNLLLSTAVYDHITDITTHRGTWAAQLGTTLDPQKIDAYKPFLVEPQPIWDWTVNELINSTGQKFSIIHQWDRVPEIKTAMEGLYAS